jgi:serine/threonine protein kinase/Tol biopolymer transport system component
MTLPPGSSLGPYEVVGAIGAGGMGEVYRARDTKLGREVALKVLPEEFAADAERMARFEREAKVLASLNHPNIASIYGFEDSSGAGTPARALVMELVEGPTLADLITRGLIPLDEALPIAKQIADGLEYAHERGIVHRDLKPANVKITPDGAVELLDFGLAKALEGDAVAKDPSSSPTMSRLATQAGIILGTAAYMAPEQAKGKPVDRRADIWAFGCVLYEMLTGKKPFDGETVTDILASVVKSEPDWNALPADVSLRIRELLERCLVKDPRRRLRDIGDARITLEETASGAGVDSGRPLPGSGGGTRRAPLRAVPWAIAGISICLAAFAGWWVGNRNVAPPPQRFPVLSFIPPPANTTFHDFGFSAGPVVVSPDGKRLAFSATDSNGVTKLYVRPLASDEAQTISGTKGASIPFWSPDGRSLGFVADEKLKTVNLANGNVEVLADAFEDTCADDGAWSPDGTILFTPQGCTGPIDSISASGGKPRPVTKLEGGDNGDTSPAFLPDNRHFIYSSSADSGSIWMGSLGSSEQKLILKDAGSPEYADGHLLFTRDNRVFAQPFDPATGKLSGEVIPLARALSYSASNGVLAFQGGTMEGRLEWFDRSGNPLGSVGPAAVYDSVKISPDGTHILAEVAQPQSNSSDLWSYPAAGGPGMRLTFGPGRKDFGAWSPDGKYIAYTCQPDGKAAICRKPANGSGTEEKLYTFGADITGSGITSPVVVDWSPDGRYISLNEHVTKASLTELSILPLFGARKPFQPAPVSAFQFDGRFSPNGHWLAYFSYETGRPEVYVVPFPGPGGKFQISQNGGWNVHWDKKGHLYFETMGNRLMEADLGFSGGAVQVKALHPLFQLNLPSFADPFYDVSPDGSRFLVVTSTDPHASRFIGLLLDWKAKLEGSK